MITEFDKSFEKSITKLNNPLVAQNVNDAITNVEKALSLKDIVGLKSLKGHKGYYRVRIGDCRIGLKLIGTNTIRFILVAYRKDIYKRFP